MNTEILYNKKTLKKRIKDAINNSQMKNYTEIKPPNRKATWNENLNNWEIPPLTPEEEEISINKKIESKYSIQNQIFLINEAIQALSKKESLPDLYKIHIDKIKEIKSKLN